MVAPADGGEHPTRLAEKRNDTVSFSLLKAPADLNQGGGGTADAAAVRPAHAVARM
jgi:hypothetical protein